MAHHRKHSTLVSCLPQVFDNQKYRMVTNYWLCSWLSWSTLLALVSTQKFSTLISIHSLKEFIGDHFVYLFILITISLNCVYCWEKIDVGHSWG